MSKHEVNGRQVVMLGTWEIFGANFACDRVHIGFVRAISESQARKRAAKKFRMEARHLTAVANLPPVFLAVKDESNGSEM